MNNEVKVSSNVWTMFGAGILLLGSYGLMAKLAEGPSGMMSLSHLDERRRRIIIVALKNR